MVKNQFLFIYSLLFLQVFIFPFTSSGQSIRQWVKYGDLSFAEKDYHGASLYYEEALKRDTMNLDLVNKFCSSLRLFNDYKKAEVYYDYLLTIDKEGRFSDVLFWYATMQKHNGKYPEAISSFQAFVNSYSKKEDFIYKKAVQEIESCAFAMELIKEKIPAKIINIGEPVNSEYADFSPVITTDSNIVFSSLRTEKVVDFKRKNKSIYQVDLFQARGMDSSWAGVVEMDSVFNNLNFHVANGTFNKERNAFYFSSCDKDYKCQIYVSGRTRKGWGRPILLPNTVNYPGANTTQPFLCNLNGQEVLLFVSDRSGGVGNLDIWYSVKEGKSGFSDAFNFGPQINTMGDEISPFYVADSSILYFSSNWHYGLGGFDIFKSHGNIRNQEQPINLGYPVNSSANDIYYSEFPDKKGGYLTSNRVGIITTKAETCCNDIWYFKYEDVVPPEEDTMLLVQEYSESISELNSKLPISLFFHNDEPMPRSWDTTVSVSYYSTYQAYQNLIPLYIEKYSHGYTGSKKQESIDQVKNFFQSEVDNGLQNLNELSAELLQELKKGKKLIIGVRGHASPLAGNDYNINLSKRRISSFVNHLKEYQNGEILPFMTDSSGGLKIVELPFGEFHADSTVNDELKNIRKSIYSPTAATERRIEVLYILPQDSSIGFGLIDSKISEYNFGEVKSGKIVEGEFLIRNTGNKTINILNITASCGCTAATVDSTNIAPGKEEKIRFKFNTDGKYGRQLKRVIVETDAIIPVKEFSITGEILK